MTSILWDVSPTYDFFVSLRVLHDPTNWQLRGAWAAGVRSRLSAENRTFLQETYHFVAPPSAWLHEMNDKSSAHVVLDRLEALDVSSRLNWLLFNSDEVKPKHTAAAERLKQILAAGNYTDDDVTVMRRELKPANHSRKQIRSLLHWHLNSAEFGERIALALRDYYDVFFAEEEKRITPALEKAHKRGRELSERLSLRELLEELAQGIQFEDIDEEKQFVLIPSFWITPLIAQFSLGEEKRGFIYGARPANDSLVPGEAVPDTLTRALKALADPTRLRILRYLSAEPHTPAELARKLRLRPPTVVHHLQSLRLAGLVEIRLTADEKRRYAARSQGVQQAVLSLDQFLSDV